MVGIVNVTGASLWFYLVMKWLLGLREGVNTAHDIMLKHIRHLHSDVLLVTVARHFQEIPGTPRIHAMWPRF